MEFKTKKPICTLPITTAGQAPNVELDCADRLSALLGIPEGIKELILEEYADGEVEIASIEALMPGRGFGSLAMNQICAAADREKIDLMVIPAGEGKKVERLKRFYARFGFEEDGEVMRRIVDED